MTRAHAAQRAAAQNMCSKPHTQMSFVSWRPGVAASRDSRIPAQTKVLVPVLIVTHSLLLRAQLDFALFLLFVDGAQLVFFSVLGAEENLATTMSATA